MAFFFFCFVFLLPSFLSNAFPAPDFSNPDVLALMEFKDLTDKQGFLSSWNPKINPCSGHWVGVSCKPGGGGRVTRLVLDGLRLSGRFDPLTRLQRLRFLSLSNNSFSGPLQLPDLSAWRPHLRVLHLSGNRFSGPFPYPFLLLRHLRRLDIADNLFSGTIPRETGLLLPHLFTFRLEGNLFSGEIPSSIASISTLLDFNVSKNHLTGDIPTLLSRFPESSFKGNPSLCGRPLNPVCSTGAIITNEELPGPVPPQNSRRHEKKVAILAIIISGTAAVLVLTASAVWICKLRGDKNLEKEKEEVVLDEEDLKLGRVKGGVVLLEGSKQFEVEDLMRGSAEMLGRGAAGTTYRVVMEEKGAQGVVVKRLRRERRGRRKEEETILKEMGRWNHRNVVSLRAYYATEDDLLLVFDYIAGGSLHSLLHGYRGPGRAPLDWETRLKLASDAANGLAFLHKSSKCVHAHHHLTSSNILIDAAGNGLISEYGLLQLHSSSPPPSSNKESSQKCDVYSFGVVLLQILTGRKEGDNNMDLSKWVQMVVREEWTVEVFDFEMVRGKEMEDEMVALLQVALLCLSREPKHRPKMNVVSKMIEDIRERGSSSRRTRTPPSVIDCSFESSSPCFSGNASPFPG